MVYSKVSWWSGWIWVLHLRGSNLDYDYQVLLSFVWVLLEGFFSGSCPPGWGQSLLSTLAALVSTYKGQSPSLVWTWSHQMLQHKRGFKQSSGMFCTVKAIYLFSVFNECRNVFNKWLDAALISAKAVEVFCAAVRFFCFFKQTFTAKLCITDLSSFFYVSLQLLFVLYAVCHFCSGDWIPLNLGLINQYTTTTTIL